VPFDAIVVSETLDPIAGVSDDKLAIVVSFDNIGFSDTEVVDDSLPADTPNSVVVPFEGNVDSNTIDAADVSLNNPDVVDSFKLTVVDSDAENSVVKFKLPTVDSLVPFEPATVGSLVKLPSTADVVGSRIAIDAFVGAPFVVDVGEADFPPHAATSSRRLQASITSS